MYPHINWSVSEPSPEITETYGDGFIIAGRVGDKMQTYFVLRDDPRINNWIHMIAIQLDPQIEEQNGRTT